MRIAMALLGLVVAGSPALGQTSSNGGAAPASPARASLSPVGVYDVYLTSPDGQKAEARFMVKGESGKYEGTWSFAAMGMEEPLPLDTIRVVGNEIQLGLMLPNGMGHRFFHLTPVSADSFVGKTSGGPRSAEVAAKKVR